MENPFVYGRVVTGEKFFGRTELIERIQNYMRAGQNIMVYGERRVGKTSLIAEAIRHPLPSNNFSADHISAQKEFSLLRFESLHVLSKIAYNSLTYKMKPVSSNVQMIR